MTNPSTLTGEDLEEIKRRCQTCEVPLLPRGIGNVMQERYRHKCVEEVELKSALLSCIAEIERLNAELKTIKDCTPNFDVKPPEHDYYERLGGF